MKYLMISLVGVCLLFASVPVMADQTADEAAIRAATKKFQDAMNEYDKDAAAALLDDSFQSWTVTARAGRIG
jgi:hypothetical protein